MSISRDSPRQKNDKETLVIRDLLNANTVYKNNTLNETARTALTRALKECADMLVGWEKEKNIAPRDIDLTEGLASIYRDDEASPRSIFVKLDTKSQENLLRAAYSMRPADNLRLEDKIHAETARAQLACYYAEFLYTKAKPPQIDQALSLFEEASIMAKGVEEKMKRIQNPDLEFALKNEKIISGIYTKLQRIGKSREEQFTQDMNFLLSKEGSEPGKLNEHKERYAKVFDVIVKTESASSKEDIVTTLRAKYDHYVNQSNGKDKGNNLFAARVILAGAYTICPEEAPSQKEQKTHLAALWMLDESTKPRVAIAAGEKKKIVEVCEKAYDLLKDQNDRDPSSRIAGKSQAYVVALAAAMAWLNSDPLQRKAEHLDKLITVLAGAKKEGEMKELIPLLQHPDIRHGITQRIVNTKQAADIKALTAGDSLLIEWIKTSNSRIGLRSLVGGQTDSYKNLIAASKKDNKREVSSSLPHPNAPQSSISAPSAVLMQPDVPQAAPASALPVEPSAIVRGDSHAASCNREVVRFSPDKIAKIIKKLTSDERTKDRAWAKIDSVHSAVAGDQPKVTHQTISDGAHSFDVYSDRFVTTQSDSETFKAMLMSYKEVHGNALPDIQTSKADVGKWEAVCKELGYHENDIKQMVKPIKELPAIVPPALDAASPDLAPTSRTPR